MVGVAGGSRGCATCRKRKIKCDEVYPVCGQCARSKRDCPGAVKGFIFLPNDTPDIAAVQNKKTHRASRGANEHRFELNLSENDRASSVDTTSSQRQASESEFSFASPASELSEPAGVASPRSPAPTQISDMPGSNNTNSIEFNVPQIMHSKPAASNSFDYSKNQATPPDPDKNSFVSSIQTFPALSTTIASIFTLSTPGYMAVSDRTLDVANLAPVITKIPTDADDQTADDASLYNDKTIVAAKLHLPMACFPKSSSTFYRFFLGHFVDYFFNTSSKTGNLAVTVSNTSDSLMQSWMYRLSEFALADDKMSPATHSARALIIGHYGLLTRDESIIRLSHQYHIRALSSQRNSFSITEAIWKDEALIATSYIILFEIFHCTNGPTTWKGLISGLGYLFQMRGPEACSIGAAGHLFRTLRALFAVFALTDVNSLFLNQVEWRELPFKGPVPKSYPQMLFDIIFEIPDTKKHAAEIRQKIRSGELHNDAQQVHDVMNKSSDLVNQLKDWRSKFEVYLLQILIKASIESGAPTVISQEHLPWQLESEKCSNRLSHEEWTRSHFFRPRISYTDGRVASVMMMYQTSLLSLYDVMLAMAPSENRSDELKKGLDDAVSAICQSAQWAYDCMTSQEMVYVALPLKTAFDVLDDEEARAWIVNYLQMVVADGGAGAGVAEVPSPVKRAQYIELYNHLPACPYCGEKIRSVPKKKKNLLAK
ncbi:hypothetical protein V1514DRAFT_319935 [Lipomyces japonicus]|uniref:uncharacterized protein n=1 Tax=Lipomyces japonicus TaxID=56871 RepID=UPI0034CF7663